MTQESEKYPKLSVKAKRANLVEAPIEDVRIAVQP